MLVLGIESSCDDLSMAVMGSGELLSCVTASQVAAHLPFGGVVPEIASRKHLEALEPTLKFALEKAGVALDDLEGIAVTYAPGLVGSLLVGLNFAKGLAYRQKIPFCGVHHIEGHLWSAFLEAPAKFPILSLVVSGGHTHLYRMESLGDYRLLGHTVDDAAGEAFDKVAKMMGLPYPGGPAIDERASSGDAKRFEFSLPRVKSNPLHTSFSGMKTAALEHWQQASRALGKDEAEFTQLQTDLAASFQHHAVKNLKRMVERALKTEEIFGRGDEQLKCLSVVGGVACNRELRQRLGELADKYHLEFLRPSPRFCTDNGAMIALVGSEYLRRGQSSPLNLNAQARKKLGES